MSMTTFNVTPIADQYVLTLISDGAAYRDNVITQTDARKVWRLSQSVGLVWMGSRPIEINEVAASAMGMDAETAIHTIARQLEQSFANDPEVIAYLEDNHPFNIFTFQCKPGRVEYWRLFFHEDRFKPVFMGELKPGQSGALVIDTDNPPWEELQRKHWQRYDADFTTADEALQAIKDCLLDAFKDMLSTLQAEGVKKIGGTIYQEVLTPQTNGKNENSNQRI